MSAALTTQASARPANRPKLIRALKVIGPALLSVLASAFVAWGSVQYVKGRDANRLDNVEKTVEKSLTRDEFNRWAEEQRDRLKEINERLRDRGK